MIERSRALTTESGAASAAWRKLGAVVLLLVGLCATLWMTAQLIYQAEGYEPGAAECDDCGVSLLLDNIGWLASAVVAYLSLALITRWTLRRVRPRGFRSAPDA